MAIYDVVTFNGENEIWEIRYNILKDYVDNFIVVEFDKTFSGKSKKPTFKYKDLPRVKYFFHTEELWSEYINIAQKSPNTEYGTGARHWVTEWAQKESIKKALAHLNSDDVIFIGDVDEIWTQDALTLEFGKKIGLRVYSYYLNNRSDEKFWGGIFVSYEIIRGRDVCLNHLRTTNNRTNAYYGWHFTSMGGYDEVKRKLEDSYTKETYANDAVMNNLEENIEDSRDFLGRNFTYTIDESDLPWYIRSNKEKYKHLWK